MDYVFEIIDKSGRKIHLTKERWTHIRKKHLEIEETEISRLKGKISDYQERLRETEEEIRVNELLIRRYVEKN